MSTYHSENCVNLDLLRWWKLISGYFANQNMSTIVINNNVNKR